MPEPSRSSGHPIPLAEDYLRAIDAVERLESNRSGVDKSWVGRAIEAARRHWRRARRIRM